MKQSCGSPVLVETPKAPACERLIVMQSPATINQVCLALEDLGGILWLWKAENYKVVNLRHFVHNTLLKVDFKTKL
jgi:hemolysin-activating ACP:hemolysin acyltransferase